MMTQETTAQERIVDAGETNAKRVQGAVLASAAHLATERVQGWENPIVASCQDASEMIAALCAERDALRSQLDAARMVKPLKWDGHPDGEGFYAFPNDAGNSLYVIDLLDSGRWRLFIGGELVKDPDDPDRVMKWDNPDDAKAYVQEDLDGRLRRILSALQGDDT